MSQDQKHIIIVGGGTAGSVLASRLSSSEAFNVTLLEFGADDDSYGDGVLDPTRAPEAWLGAVPVAISPMLHGDSIIPMLQGRMMGGTSAVNGLATLRGLPEDYDGWANMGLEGWAWHDVIETFKAAETDLDFPGSKLHGSSGPLTVRRWKREEMGKAQIAFYDGMKERGQALTNDINDRSQLPGLGVFPVTIDESSNRLTTSLAYLNSEVRGRTNLKIRTQSEVKRVNFTGNRAVGVTLADGEQITADEVVVCAGAIWTPNLLMRSGIGPADQLQAHQIKLVQDLPVGETMSDHIGPGIRYRHEGARGGTAGPAQSLYIGASDGHNVDYHLFPIAPPLGDGPTEFMMAAFLLRSSGLGSVRLAESETDGPIVTVPPIPDDGIQRLQDGFARLADWEQSEAYKNLGCEQIDPIDLTAPGAVETALANVTISYGHMTSTCPMGTVLDANCNVQGVENLRVVDASSMPTIPSGNTYLGCVMMAERVASKIINHR